jgi:FeoB-associated Cys-rich membrane protein
MTATTQLIVVGVLIAMAAVYVVRSAWRTWFGKSAKGCGSGCGKCATPAAEAKQDGRFPLPQA